MQESAAAKEDAGGRSRRAGFQKIAARRHDVSPVVLVGPGAFATTVSIAAIPVQLDRIGSREPSTAPGRSQRRTPYAPLGDKAAILEKLQQAP
jgi:hypothetical protein